VLFSQTTSYLFLSRPLYKSLYETQWSFDTENSNKEDYINKQLCRLTAPGRGTLHYMVSLEFWVVTLA